MTEAFWTLFTAGLGVGLALMVVAWFVARRLGRADLLAAASAATAALLAGVYFLLGEGDPARKALLCGMAVLASARLAVHLARRLGPSEDGRAAALRAQYPRHPWLMFLALFALQGFLVALLSAPVAIVATDPDAGLGPWECAGLALWLAAFLGESLADHQLAAFRASSANLGRACRAGLWRYSRHPNYFFQWLLSVAYFVFAAGSPAGWITVFCPALTLCFLTRVTGIPPTETHALATRGDDYRAYQRATSPFVPWFPKRP